MVYITSVESDLYFSKARTKYFECINSEDNEFLNNEVKYPLELIQLQNLTIKFIFSELDLNKYVVEVNLNLIDNLGGVIGKYMYQENNEGESVDDSLIIF